MQLSTQNLEASKNPLFFRGIVLTHKTIFCILLVPMFLSLWITGWQLYAMLQTDAHHAQLSLVLNNSMWVGVDGKVPMFAAFPVVSSCDFVQVFNHHVFRTLSRQ